MPSFLLCKVSISVSTHPKYVRGETRTFYPTLPNILLRSGAPGGRFALPPLTKPPGSQHSAAVAVYPALIRPSSWRVGRRRHKMSATQTRPASTPGTSGVGSGRTHDPASPTSQLLPREVLLAEERHPLTCPGCWAFLCPSLRRFLSR